MHFESTFTYQSCSSVTLVSYFACIHHYHSYVIFINTISSLTVFGEQPGADWTSDTREPDKETKTSGASTWTSTASQRQWGWIRPSQRFVQQQCRVKLDSGKVWNPWDTGYICLPSVCIFCLPSVCILSPHLHTGCNPVDKLISHGLLSPVIKFSDLLPTSNFISRPPFWPSCTTNFQKKLWFDTSCLLCIL